MNSPSVDESAASLASELTDQQLGSPLERKITEASNPRGYSDISTVYAYYTPEQTAEHGKRCEWWTEFGHAPETAPYSTGSERTFIEQVDAENPGKFASYLISWSGCE